MYQNLFITPNFKQKLNRLILDILRGLKVNQNEKLLNQYRKKDQYPLTLCQLLLQCMQLPLTSFNKIQDNKKSFIALQIKKISTRTSTDQCWRLMRQVYLTEPNKQVASLIRQTCLFYRSSTLQSNLLHLFLNVDIKHRGILGLIRYLTFVHEMMRQEFSKLENDTIREYGEDVVERLLEVLGWEVGEFVVESLMTALVVVKGVIGERDCWGDVPMWEKIISKVMNETNSPLVNCLAKHFMQEITNKSFNQMITSSIDITSKNQPINFSLQLTQLPQALHYCLKKTKPLTLLIQSRFYFDCIEILSIYWLKILRKIGHHDQLQEFQSTAMDVVEVYAEYFAEIQAEQGDKLDFGQYQEEDEMESRLNHKRLSFLKTVLYMYPQQRLKALIQSRSNYAIQLMQFSLYLPCLHHNNMISVALLETLLKNLQQALAHQSDTYLFIKQKSSVIWTLLKYIAKYYGTFPQKLILKICYVVDFLVFKCDTIARQGFELLEVLVQKLIHMEGLVLAEFLCTTLAHVNQNQWLQSDICYFHAINILLELSPQIVFQRPSNPYYNHQFSQLQSHILTMTKNMIALTKKSFNYDTIHRLNSLLQHLLQPSALHLIQAIRYDQIFQVVTINFKHEILTNHSADVYFHFIQFSDNRLKLLDTLDNYHFWSQCDSERLIFFVHIYTKFIDSHNKFFTSSQAQHKIIKLRKNLWQRYKVETDPDEKQKIVNMFASNPKHFEEFYLQTYHGEKWRQNKIEYWSKPEVRPGSHIRERMEIE